MNRAKSKQRMAKKLARLEQGRILAAKSPALDPVPPIPVVSVSAPLRQENEMLLREIELIRQQVRGILQHAAAKIVARALVEGMKEASVD